MEENNVSLNSSIAFGAENVNEGTSYSPEILESKGAEVKLTPYTTISQGANSSDLDYSKMSLRDVVDTLRPKLQQNLDAIERDSELYKPVTKNDVYKFNTTTNPISRALFGDYTSRYNKYLPGADNETLNAQEQSGWSIAGNALGGMIFNAGEAFSGYIAANGRSIDAAANGDWSKMWDTEFTENQAKDLATASDYFAIYHDASKSSGLSSYIPFLSGSGEKWGHLAQSFGFTVGTLLGVAAENALFAYTTGGVGNLLRGSKTLKGVFDAVRMLSFADKSVDALKGLSMAQKMAANGLRYAKNVNVATNAAFSEGSMEAAMASLESMNESIAKYKELYGVEPDEAEIQKIKEQREKVGNTTFSLNAPILLASNFAMFGNYMRTGKFFSQPISELSTRAVADGVRAELKKGIATNAWRASKKIAGVVPEGLEEVSQSIASESAKRHYDLYKSDTGKSFLDAMVVTTGDLYKSGRMAEDFLSGAIIGGISMGIGAINDHFRGNKDNIEDSINQYNTTFSENIRNAIEGIGERRMPEQIFGVAGTQTANKLQAGMEGMNAMAGQIVAKTNKDKKEFYDHHSEANKNIAYANWSNGMSQIGKELTNATIDAIPANEYAAQYMTGQPTDEQIAEHKEKKKAEFAKMQDEFDTTMDIVEERYGNPFDKTKNPELHQSWEEVKRDIAFYKQDYRDAISRSASLNESISKGISKFYEETGVKIEQKDIDLLVSQQARMGEIQKIEAEEKALNTQLSALDGTIHTEQQKDIREKLDNLAKRKDSISKLSIITMASATMDKNDNDIKKAYQLGVNEWLRESTGMEFGTENPLMEDISDMLVLEAEGRFLLSLHNALMSNGKLVNQYHYRYTKAGREAREKGLQELREKHRQENGIEPPSDKEKKSIEDEFSTEEINAMKKALGVENLYEVEKDDIQKAIDKLDAESNAENVDLVRNLEKLKSQAYAPNPVIANEEQQAEIEEQKAALNREQKAMEKAREIEKNKEQSTTQSESNPALRDVDSTAKALEEINNELLGELFDEITIPKLLYHWGGAKGINKFSPTSEMEFTGGGKKKANGIYFTDNKDLALRYKKGKPEGELYSAQVVAKNPKYVSLNKDSAYISDEKLNELKKEGYDSVIFKGESGYQEVVIFDADNILKDTDDLAELYHKAKQDGSNPELVKAVESLLSKEQSTSTTQTESNPALNTKLQELNKQIEEAEKSKLKDLQPLIEEKERLEKEIAEIEKNKGNVKQENEQTIDEFLAENNITQGMLDAEKNKLISHLNSLGLEIDKEHAFDDIINRIIKNVKGRFLKKVLQAINQLVGNKLKTKFIFSTVKDDNAAGIYESYDDTIKIFLPNLSLRVFTLNKRGKEYQQETNIVEVFNKVFIHELIHAFTILKLRGKETNVKVGLASLMSPKLKDEKVYLSRRDEKAVQSLNNIFDYLKDNELLKGEYGISDIVELVTEALSNEGFAEKLKNIELPENLRYKTEFNNVFENILFYISDLVSNLLGLSSNINENESALESISAIINDFGASYREDDQQSFMKINKAYQQFENTIRYAANKNKGSTALGIENTKLDQLKQQLAEINKKISEVENRYNNQIKSLKSQVESLLSKEQLNNQAKEVAATTGKPKSKTRKKGDYRKYRNIPPTTVDEAIYQYFLNGGAITYEALGKIFGRVDEKGVVLEDYKSQVDSERATRMAIIRKEKNGGKSIERIAELILPELPENLRDGNYTSDVEDFIRTYSGFETIAEYYDRILSVDDLTMEDMVGEKDTENEEILDNYRKRATELADIAEGNDRTLTEEERSELQDYMDYASMPFNDVVEDESLMYRIDAILNPYVKDDTPLPFQKVSKYGNILSPSEMNIARKLLGRAFPNIVEMTDDEVFKAMNGLKLPIGMMLNGKMWINSERETLETRMHELGGHVFFLAMKSQYPSLYNKLMGQLQNAIENKSDKELNSVVKFVKELYPELAENSTQFNEEVTATYMGQIMRDGVASAIKSKGIKSDIAYWLNYIYERLMNLLGIDNYLSIDKFANNTLGENLVHIGKGILNGRVRSDISTNELATMMSASPTYMKGITKEWEELQKAIDVLPVVQAAEGKVKIVHEKNKVKEEFNEDKDGNFSFLSLYDMGVSVDEVMASSKQYGAKDNIIKTLTNLSEDSVNPDDVVQVFYSNGLGNILSEQELNTLNQLGIKSFDSSVKESYGRGRIFFYRNKPNDVPIKKVLEDVAKLSFSNKKGIHKLSKNGKEISSTSDLSQKVNKEALLKLKTGEEIAVSVDFDNEWNQSIVRDIRKGVQNQGNVDTLVLTYKNQNGDILGYVRALNGAFDKEDSGDERKKRISSLRTKAYVALENAVKNKELSTNRILSFQEELSKSNTTDERKEFLQDLINKAVETEEIGNFLPLDIFSLNAMGTQAIYNETLDEWMPVSEFLEKREEVVGDQDFQLAYFKQNDKGEWKYFDQKGRELDIMADNWNKYEAVYLVSPNYQRRAYFDTVEEGRMNYEEFKSLDLSTVSTKLNPENPYIDIRLKVDLGISPQITRTTSKLEEAAINLNGNLTAEQEAAGKNVDVNADIVSDTKKSTDEVMGDPVPEQLTQQDEEFIYDLIPLYYGLEPNKDTYNAQGILVEEMNDGLLYIGLILTPAVGDIPRENFIKILESYKSLKTGQINLKEFIFTIVKNKESMDNQILVEGDDLIAPTRAPEGAKIIKIDEATVNRLSLLFDAQNIYVQHKDTKFYYEFPKKNFSIPIEKQVKNAIRQVMMVNGEKMSNFDAFYQEYTHNNIDLSVEPQEPINLVRVKTTPYAVYKFAQKENIVNDIKC